MSSLNWVRMPPHGIYPSKTFNDVYDQKKDMLDQFKSVQNKNVYDTQGGGPLAWYEQRLAEYDVVALDMCTLVGTANPNSSSIHVRKWFRNYFTDPVGTQGTCNVPEDITLAYVPEQAECTSIQSSSGGFPSEGSAAATNSSQRTSAAFVLCSSNRCRNCVHSVGLRTRDFNSVVGLCINKPRYTALSLP